jgi:hypothetical protein
MSLEYFKKVRPVQYTVGKDLRLVPCSRVVTIDTQGLTFRNSTFCPHSVFMCFVWISEQIAIISLYSMNWLVFITETVCVYCAVRTESLYIIGLHVRLCNVRHNTAPLIRTPVVRIGLALRVTLSRILQNYLP